MFGNMMGKLEEAKRQTEEVKKRLDTIYVSGSTPGDKVKVISTANKTITEINIDDSLLANKEELTDLLLIATNSALEQAGKVAEAEMAAVAKDVMPNIPGMGGLGKMFK